LINKSNVILYSKVKTLIQVDVTLLKAKQAL